MNASAISAETGRAEAAEGVNAAAVTAETLRAEAAEAGIPTTGTPLPVAKGGTGSGTQNFADLTTDQAIGGIKTFTGEVIVPAPSASGDAATKAYVDAITLGLSLKTSVSESTTGPLPPNTYDSGALTLTADSPGGPLVLDTITVSLGDRVLVMNETAAPENNGIYTVTDPGSGADPYVLTRSADMDTGAQVPGAYTFVEQGAVNGGAGFVVTGDGGFTIGVTPINWTQFSHSGTVTAGTGLTEAGTTISLTVPVPVAYGGTGATSGPPALTALGAAAASDLTAETARAEAAESANASAAAAALPLAGGTLTGPLGLPGNPASALQAAPKQYVDAETTRAEAAEAGYLPLTSLPLPVASGGTNATTAAAARTNLGLGTGAVANIDAVPTDIAPLGTQAAGATGKLADAGHVHPTTAIIDGVTVSGVPSAGQAITATSGTAATWQTPAAGVTLDGTAGDIQALGAQAAGAIGKAADAGHVHPTTGVVLTSALPLAVASGGTAATTAGAARTSAWGSGTAAVAAIDTTAGDIAALGAQAAGATGKVADAGHVHPTTGVVLSSSLPLAIASGGTAATTAAAARTSLGLGTGAVANIDATSTDIAALGTQAAGATGKLADAGHVHPATGVVLASSLPLAIASGGTGATTAGAALSALGAATAASVTAETSRAETAEGTLLPLAGGTMTGPIAMGGAKVTGLANGTGAQDAAAFGQIPAALPPNGAASNDLSGTYPGPTVAKVNGVTVSGAPTASGQVITSTSVSAAGWQAPAAGVTLAGDLGNTVSVPWVTGTHLATPLPVAQGGTAATTAGAALTSLGAASAANLTAETSRATTAEGANAVRDHRRDNPRGNSGKRAPPPRRRHHVGCYRDGRQQNHGPRERHHSGGRGRVRAGRGNLLHRVSIRQPGTIADHRHGLEPHPDRLPGQRHVHEPAGGGHRGNTDGLRQAGRHRRADRHLACRDVARRCHPGAEPGGAVGHPLRVRDVRRRDHLVRVAGHRRASAAAVASQRRHRAGHGTGGAHRARRAAPRRRDHVRPGGHGRQQDHGPRQRHRSAGRCSVRADPRVPAPVRRCV